MQLEKLWEYTQIDMEAERFKGEMQKAPNRVKLLKLRNFLVEQQNNMKRIEAEVTAMSERMETMRTEAAKLEVSLSELIKETKEAQDDSIAELDGLIEEAQKLNGLLSKYESEIERLRKDVDLRDRQQRNIRTSAAKSKAEYDQLKTVYDTEFKRDNEKLEALKAKVDQAGKSIPSDLLAKYKEIRKQSIPPMAKLSGSRCSGCNMGLPSAVARRITEGDELVVCDNCGRILYVAEEE